jgi:hypothetical protein
MNCSSQGHLVLGDISTTRFGNGVLGQELSTNAFLYLCPLHFNAMKPYRGDNCMGSLEASANVTQILFLGLSHDDCFNFLPQIYTSESAA